MTCSQNEALRLLYLHTLPLRLTGPTASCWQPSADRAPPPHSKVDGTHRELLAAICGQRPPPPHPKADPTHRELLAAVFGQRPSLIRAATDRRASALLKRGGEGASLQTLTSVSLISPSPPFGRRKGRRRVESRHSLWKHKDGDLGLLLCEPGSASLP